MPAAYLNAPSSEGDSLPPCLKQRLSRQEAEKLVPVLLGRPRKYTDTIQAYPCSVCGFGVWHTGNMQIKRPRRRR